MGKDDKKRKKSKESLPKSHNDQLGENASEEFRSDEYSNTSKNRKK